MALMRSALATASTALLHDPPTCTASYTYRIFTPHTTHHLCAFAFALLSAYRFLALAAFCGLASSFAPPSTRAALLHRSSAAVTPAASTVRCAYNPQPSKARPKKQKQPKQKVKAATPAAPAAALVPEQTFWEGAPSITETFIPGLSLFTVVGVIPFTASLARQAWTKYKFTNRRIEVASGFQGKDIVQVLYREITDVKWLRRYGGAAGDIVFDLQDGSKLEVRSVPEFDRNLAFIMSMVQDDARDASEYPDTLAREYLAKVASGEEPRPELPETPVAA